MDHGVHTHVKFKQFVVFQEIVALVPNCLGQRVSNSQWKLTLGQITTPSLVGAPKRLEALCPYYLWNFQTQKVEILHTFRQVQPHFLRMKIFSLGGVQGAQHPL